MTVEVLGGLIFFIFAMSLILLGTYWTLRHLARPPLYMDAPFKLYPISILKPLKGLDPHLSKNLESFFNLKYPEFELIFSISKENDPAVPIVRELIHFYPHIPARLIIGDIEIGPNPKVNNLIKSYESAKYDWVLVSDSNTCVPENYLKRAVAHLDSSIGVMTSLVVGTDATSFGGELESVYLNTFYARWMIIAEKFKLTCVIGKSMFFRRSVAERFGGIRTLAQFIAEDYMTGQAMKKLGMRVIIMSDPIVQPIGDAKLAQFWKRHLRWGRIRKSHAPFAFILEPMVGAIGLAMLGCFCLVKLNLTTAVTGFLSCISVHLLCDLILIGRLKGQINLKDVFFWFIRELTVIPMWLHILSGRTVNWRGQSLVIKRGGLVEFPS